MTRRPWLLAAIALAPLGSSCLGGDVDYSLGFPCEQSLDCAQGHTCQYGRCREWCSTDADCRGGCVATLVPNSAAATYDHTQRVCTHAAEERCAANVDCPDLLRCADDGICRERCEQGVASMSCGVGRECVPVLDGAGEVSHSVCVEGASE